MLCAGIAEGGVVVRVEIAQIIPTTAGPLGHGVGFAHGAIRQADPARGACKRWLAFGSRLVIVKLRRKDGQGGFRQRLVPQSPVRAAFPNYRERLAPVTLAAEKPVAQFIVDGLVAKAV